MVANSFDEDMIRNRIRSIITVSGQSDREVSLDIGRAPNYIHELLKGKSLPSMRTFLDFCHHFKITPADFFNLDNEDPGYNRVLLDEIKRITGHDFPLMADAIKRLERRDFTALKRFWSIFQNQVW